MEGTLGESIVHVQEEKGFAFGSLGMQTFCMLQAVQVSTAMSSDLYQKTPHAFTPERRWPLFLPLDLPPAFQAQHLEY